MRFNRSAAAAILAIAAMAAPSAAFADTVADASCYEAGDVIHVTGRLVADDGGPVVGADLTWHALGPDGRVVWQTCVRTVEDGMFDAPLGDPEQVYGCWCAAGAEQAPSVADGYGLVAERERADSQGGWQLVVWSAAPGDSPAERAARAGRSTYHEEKTSYCEEETAYYGEETAYYGEETAYYGEDARRDAGHAYYEWQAAYDDWYAASADPGGALTRTNTDWYASHWWSYYGGCIQRLVAGDVVVIDGRPVTIYGSIIWPQASTYDAIRAVVGDAVVFQTRVGDGVNVVIAYGW